MPGMSANPLIFKRIKFSDEKYEIHFLKWAKPVLNESIENYSKRLLDFIKHKNPILIGVSFGGLIVQEISKLIDVEKVIIISSIKSNRELPLYMKSAKFLKLYNFMFNGINYDLKQIRHMESFFNKKGFSVLGIDISKKIIDKNSKNSFENLKFKKFDIEKDILKDYFNIIYCRFFLHAINKIQEDKLITLIKNVKKEKTLVFFEFRNFKDKIFGNFKAKDHNKIVEFEKGHFRRIIEPTIFKKKFLSKTKAKIIYQKSSTNLSIVKKDNPNLTRFIFKF